MKSPVPDTRHSLIARLPNARDVEAWEEFASIYQPLVFRLARSKGFQSADAHEISQEVLIAVARAVERWEPDAAKGRFRDWLFRIARNLMIKYLTRRRHQPWGAGSSDVARLLELQTDRADVGEEVIELEYRREVFRWAAEKVRDQVTARTWQAFWKTSVENIATEEVAESLEMTSGAVYIACSRVRNRLRATVEQFTDMDWRDLQSTHSEL